MVFCSYFLLYHLLNIEPKIMAGLYIRIIFQNNILFKPQKNAKVKKICTKMLRHFQSSNNLFYEDEVVQ